MASALSRTCTRARHARFSTGRWRGCGGCDIAVRSPPTGRQVTAQAFSLPIAPALVPGPWCGLAMVFLRDAAARAGIEAACEAEGIGLAGWRKVPVDRDALGDSAVATMPGIEQLVLVWPFGLGAGRGRGARLSRPPTGRARTRRVRRVALVSHRHLQGAVRGRSAGRVLRGSARSDARGSVRDLPSALLDEHVALVGARSAFPAALPQR